MGERTVLSIVVEPRADKQLDEAHAWWQINRPAAPNAIREDFESMAKILASTPGIGRRATNTRTRNVRQVFLRRVGFVIYYRVIGSPPRLDILAFWHSKRGKGPRSSVLSALKSAVDHAGGELHFTVINTVILSRRSCESRSDEAA